MVIGPAIRSGLRQGQRKVSHSRDGARYGCSPTPSTDGDNRHPILGSQITPGVNDDRTLGESQRREFRMLGADQKDMRRQFREVASCSMVVALGDIEPGEMPPISAWLA